MSFPESWHNGMQITPRPDGILEPNAASTFVAECLGCGKELLEFTSRMQMWEIWYSYGKHLRESHRIG